MKLRFFRIVGAALIALGVLSACGGSHSSLPAVPGGAFGAAKARVASLAASGGDIVAIDAGGAAAGDFAADEDYTAAGTWTYNSTKTIATPGIADPAPQAVYQTQRTGPTVSYTIGGLTPGTTYAVNLSFAELFWTAPKQRVFNIAINGATVAANFDIVAAAGAADTAVLESFSATATSSGTIAIVLTGVTNNAVVNAIEIAASGTSSPSSGVYIDSGGAADGKFVADEDYAAAGTYTYAGTGTIDTSAVSNPAPQGVYLTQRTGVPTIAYTVGGLTANAQYTVRLDFAELFFTSAGQRIFNVSINGATVLSNFDVFATAGHKNKAVAEIFEAVANGSGEIAITLTATTNNSILGGIEISSGTSATPTPTATPTSTPLPGATPAFNTWPSYGYDAGRTGFNPNTKNLTPTSISALHLAWQTAVAHNGYTQSQPIVLTNIAGYKALLVVANFAQAEAFDGLSGKEVWSTALPDQSNQDCGIAGISGTAAYDASLGALFMSAGSGKGNPNHSLLYRLDAATGKVTGSVDITPVLEPGEANYTHGGITLANGRVYVGTGSDCEGSSTGKYPSWRGRVVAVDPDSMTLLGTFFTTWQQPGAYAAKGNYGGGGVWGWGGVSTDPSGNVYVATGNGETAAAVSPQKIAAPFVAAPSEQAGYAEQLVKLSADLSTVEGANYPGFNFTIGYGDLDYAGTPVVFQPPATSGCSLRTATQGKGGKLVINDAASLSVIASYDLSIPNGSAYYIGNPGYSPATGYVYAPITSSGAGSAMLPPGLAALGDCGRTMVWHAQFGPDSSLYQGENPRSAPTVTAGGVVFIGTPCTSNGKGGCGSPGAVSGALWAVDAATGIVLNGGKPIVITGDNIRMAPSADGDWVFLLDNSGNMYGFTVDPTIKAVTVSAGQRANATLKFHHD